MWPQALSSPFGGSAFEPLGHPELCSCCLQELQAGRAPGRNFQKLPTLKNKGTQNPQAQTPLNQPQTSLPTPQGK